MPNIITTTPCSGFLEDLLGFGKDAASAYLGYKQQVSQQKLDIQSAQVQAELARLEAAAKLEQEAAAAKRRPLYIGAAVVGAVALFLVLRRRR